MAQESVLKIGFWSGLASTVLSIIYIIPQLVIGIDLPASPRDLLLIQGPSFFLAPSFLILMISIHHFAPVDRKIWSHIGVVFAVAYFVFVTIVYSVGLTIQIPHTIQGDLDKYQLLQYIPKSFMTAIDALGYASMSLAMLFASPVFGTSKLQSWIRRLFIANGILAPVILSTQVYPKIAYIGGFWIITFPSATCLLTIMFKKGYSKDCDSAN
jgi:hypothetical protein